MNQSKNVTSHQIALGSAEGMLPFVPSENGRALARLATALDSSTISVSCTTVDAMRKKILGDRVITLLKIDTEGYEAAVLEGAEQSLRNGAIKAAYYEVCPPLAERAGYSATGASEILHSHGYTLFRPGESGTLQNVRSGSQPLCLQCLVNATFFRVAARDEELFMRGHDIFWKHRRLYGASRTRQTPGAIWYEVDFALQPEIDSVEKIFRRCDTFTARPPLSAFSVRGYLLERMRLATRRKTEPEIRTVRPIPVYVQGGTP